MATDRLYLPFLSLRLDRTRYGWRSSALLRDLRAAYGRDGVLPGARWTTPFIIQGCGRLWRVPAVRLRYREFTGLDVEEFTATIVRGVLRAERRFRDGAGASFLGYAMLSALEAVRSECRAHGMVGELLPRNGATPPATSPCVPMRYDEDERPITDGIDPRPGPADVTAEREVRELLAGVRLTRVERAVMHWRYQVGLSLEDIGRRFRRSREWVRLIEQNVIRRLREAYAREVAA